ncbi:Nicotinate dehydrogenase subunit B [Streptomyces sp. RB5]|uniref:Nicotinate dehydrogenase subunit B n=1 Tax=Streptomyces smaragdinus TaxID=2585196 RepID=A0A7K0CJ58_9ACTN|nr:molybdopterin cofactor-binding domain-containing protein [Streptomyces smaragdinus]MQY12794.1 Nicotinate dehydrogenase subunit B [Streptomyces smaragdinus]
MRSNNEPGKLSRRSLLRAGGALVVMSAAVPAALRPSIAQAAAADVPFPTPDLNELATWLTVHANSDVTWRTGRVELGQGNRTALAQMVAEELDVAFDKVTMVMGSTAVTPDQGVTAASSTIARAGRQARQMAAEARAALLALASEVLGVPVGELTVENGVVRSSEKTGRKQVHYGQLVRGRVLTAVTPADGQGAALKPPGEYRLVGRSVPRVDIEDKVRQKTRFVHDIRVPGMLHARVVHPKGIGSTVVSVGELPAGSNAQVVRVGNLVAVVAEQEWDAVRGAVALPVTWSDWNGLPAYENWPAAMRAIPSKVMTHAQKGDFDGAYASAAVTLEATYQTPFENHGMIGPSCGIADVRADGSVTVWSSTQYPQGLRKAVAQMLGIANEQVEVVWADGSGPYGRFAANYDDAASEAVFLSRELGRPVRVQWTRADEHIWEPHGPGTLHDMSAGIDESGNVVAWKHDAFMAPNNDSTMLGPILAGVQGPTPRKPVGSWTGPDLYQFPNLLELAHQIPELGADTSPYPFGIRTTYLRSPGQYQITFAQEAFVDEIAAETGRDPLQLRLNLLTDQRATAVLRAAAEAAGWESRPSPRSDASTTDGTVTGQGVAFVVRDGTYAAAVVTVEVTPATGKILLTEVAVAQDQGEIINPRAIERQITSCVIQTASRVLHEEVKFDTSNVTTVDWRSYPLLRLDETPTIKTVLVPNPGTAPTGVGEPAVNVMPSAISSAVFDATGVRLRTMPFTPEAVKAAMG